MVALLKIIGTRVFRIPYASIQTVPNVFVTKNIGEMPETSLNREVCTTWGSNVSDMTTDPV